MSVYVDVSMWTYTSPSGLTMKMCHMTADTSQELLAMADRLGLRRSWIQNRGTEKEHFDVCKSKRALAVRFGAIELSKREAAIWIGERRKRFRLAQASRASN
jgi:hypothetical protein